MIAGLVELVESRALGLGGASLCAADLLARDLPRGGVARCRVLHAADGAYAFNLARGDDRDLIPALTGRSGDPWDALAHAIADEGGGAIYDRALSFHMPVARLGEAHEAIALDGEFDGTPSAAGSRVIDMSALWAGPLCAGLLARAGAEVLRIDSIGRPDPTPRVSPGLDRRINAGKRHLALDLRRAADRTRLLDRIAAADILVTSARPAALGRLGLTPEALFARHPRLIWVAVTAYGFSGRAAERVGFGDDCAVAGGLVAWREGRPELTGDAVADPLTGIEAARSVLATLTGRRAGGAPDEPVLLDISLARVARGYARRLEP